MKIPPFFLFISCVIVAAWVYRIESHLPSLLTVDINDIVFKTAQSLAKTNVDEDKLQRRMIQFKKGLETSLREFAHKKGAIVLPKATTYGALADETKAFIAYHNGESA